MSHFVYQILTNIKDARILSPHLREGSGRITHAIEQMCVFVVLQMLYWLMWT